MLNGLKSEVVGVLGKYIRGGDRIIGVRGKFELEIKI